MQFKKKIDPKEIEDKLSGLKAKDLSSKLKDLSKQLLEGETCEIVGHLLESENNLGRSIVIDLNAPLSNNIRQVDHRTIEWIIFRNVKYSLGKKAPGTEELPLKYDNAKDQKWNPSKLAVGNWFQSSTYYKVKEIVDKDTCKVVAPNATTNELTMSRDIMEYEMHSATTYDKEEKLSRSNIIELMSNAKECVFTVTFHKQLDDSHVKETLSKAPKDVWGNATKLKQLSKDLTLGPECTMTCFLSRSENKLGRSRVIDLNAHWGYNWRQVDHRTVTSLILKNVKYVVK
mgnify:CR=1 FL=1